MKPKLTKTCLWLNQDHQAELTAIAVDRGLRNPSQLIRCLIHEVVVKRQKLKRKEAKLD